MTELLTLPAALLMGLAASGHCMVMCGGIAGALALGTGAPPGPRPTAAGSAMAEAPPMAGTPVAMTAGEAVAVSGAPAGMGPVHVLAGPALSRGTGSGRGQHVMNPPGRAGGSSAFPLLLASQLGRISSYAIAGALVGGLSGGALALFDSESVRVGLRILSALALLLAAAVIAGWVRDPGLGFGSAIWRHIAPWGRRWLPLTTGPRAFAFGMVWGWMPCGFVYSVLLVAALAADPLRSAATMAAFGLGTLPAMLTTAVSAPALRNLFRGAGPRRAVGVMLVLFAIATAAVPLLMFDAGGHQEHVGHVGYSVHGGPGDRVDSDPPAGHGREAGDEGDADRAGHAGHGAPVPASAAADPAVPSASAADPVRSAGPAVTAGSEPQREPVLRDDRPPQVGMTPREPVAGDAESAGAVSGRHAGARHAHTRGAAHH